MEKEVDLKGHLDMWMTDTCNRYFHILYDMGLIDIKKAKKLSSKIINMRNDMLDEHVPFFVKTTFYLLEKENLKTKKI